MELQANYINDLNIFSFYLSEVYYRAGLTPKQYQVELERQLRKTTLGISVGLLKSFAPNTKSMFDPYGHFGQTFQQIGESDNNINQYKICEVKPPSIEKVGSRLLVQVNLCQKHLFSHQLTHNMTKNFH